MRVHAVSTANRRRSRRETRTVQTYGRPGQNLAAASYYRGAFPYLDLMRISGSSWNSANSPTRPVTENANGWLPGLPNTDSVYCNVVLSMTGYGSLPPGDYKMISTSAATLGFHTNCGAGITNKVPGVGLATFTVVAGSGADHTLGVTVTNNTGAPIDVTDLVIVHVDHEALHNAGKFYQPSFLADLQNCSVIRTLDWTTANNSSEMVSAADLPSMADRSWANNVSHCPYSVMGALINELRAAYPGRDPWLHITTPLGVRYVQYSTDATTNVITAAGHDFVGDQAVMLFSYSAAPGGLSKGLVYYVRDLSGDTFRLASTPGGAAIDITETLGLSPGRRMSRLDWNVSPLMEAIFAELYAACPTAKIKAEYTNEPWNTAFTQFQWLQYPGAYIAGISGGSHPKGYAYGSLKTWKAAETAGFPRGQVKRVLNGQAANFSNMSSMFDYADPGIISAGALVKDLCDEYAVGAYCYFSDPSLNEIPAEDAITGGFHVGSDSLLYDAMYYGTTRAAQRAASTKSALAAVNPAIVLTSYECGHHFFYSGAAVTDMNTLGERFKAWLNSASGLAWAQDYRDRVFVANEIQDMVWFTSGGLWSSSTTAMEQWGIKPGTHQPDTTISAWFKTL